VPKNRTGSTKRRFLFKNWVSMKKISINILSLLLTTTSLAQEPISLTYKAIKLFSRSEKGISARYEIHIIATIRPGWHMYSQLQPEDAIAVPTTIDFISNPLIKKEGKIIEIGKLEKKMDATLGIGAWQYSDKVDFLQYINLKSRASTILKGSMEYQVCTDQKCLPPKKIEFSLRLE
jgi:thiol:disulfide interchange protein DsbD